MYTGFNVAATNLLWLLCYASICHNQQHMSQLNSMYHKIASICHNSKCHTRINNKCHIIVLRYKLVWNKFLDVLSFLGGLLCRDCFQKFTFLHFVCCFVCLFLKKSILLLRWALLRREFFIFK